MIDKSGQMPTLCIQSAWHAVNKLLLDHDAVTMRRQWLYKGSSQGSKIERAGVQVRLFQFLGGEENSTVSPPTALCWTPALRDSNK
jgi:hypothetical protein